MKSLMAAILLMTSFSSYSQESDPATGTNTNHGVTQGCEGNGCTYSSPSSRRRARQRFRDEEMQNIEQMENKDKPSIKVQPQDDSF